MSKLVTMFVEENNSRGTTFKKASESPNGEGPPPVFVATRLVVEGKDGLTNLGFYQGTPVECDKLGKKAINKELNRLGFRSTGRGVDDQGRWVTHNTCTNGARVSMTVLGGGKYRFHRSA